MAFHFPNMTRPLKAAKRLKKVWPHIALYEAQRAVARVSGYENWFHMEVEHASGPPCVLDETLSVQESVQRHVSMSLSLSKMLGCQDGDAQYALSAIRLTGSLRPDFSTQERIRTECWRRSAMPDGPKKTPGSTFYVKEKGFSKRRAYWKKSSESVSFICDTVESGMCADFEAIFPRKRVDDFIPLRLWLPYGKWTTSAGDQIFFSRDYKPLWRIFPDQTLDRIAPWIWVEDIVREEWFFEQVGENWNSESTKIYVSEILVRLGVFGLPALVDALPILVNINNIHSSISDAVKIMRTSDREFRRQDS